jgi:hypothetical protein
MTPPDSRAVVVPPGFGLDCNDQLGAVAAADGPAEAHASTSTRLGTYVPSAIPVNVTDLSIGGRNRFEELVRQRDQPD